jgi:hypothetical protein
MYDNYSPAALNRFESTARFRRAVRDTGKWIDEPHRQLHADRRPTMIGLPSLSGFWRSHLLEAVEP